MPGAPMRRPNGNVRLVSAPDVFPLSISANNRYYVNGQGTPTYLHIEAAWSVVVNLTDSEQDTYLSNCVANNINGLIVNLIEHQFGANAPNDRSGNAPFSGTAFQSSLGSAYHTRAHNFISRALAAGIMPLINRNYAGFGGGSEGWNTEINAASQAQRQTYGTNVSNYYKDLAANLIMDFGDYDPGAGSRGPYDDIWGAQVAADPRLLKGNHYGTNVSSHDVAAEAYSWDYVYKWGTAGSCFVHDVVDDGWAASPTRPVIFAEGRYQGENSATALDVLRQAWGAFCAGAAGHSFGDKNIWAFGNGPFQDDTWQNAINNTGGIADGRSWMKFLKSFIDGIPGWHLTVPDRTSTLVTAGRGSSTSSDYVTARFSPTLAVINIPAGSASGAITVDRTEFSGTFTADWYDPRTGGVTGIGTGIANTGTQSFTAPSTNPAVLRIKVP